MSQHEQGRSRAGAWLVALSTAAAVTATCIPALAADTGVQRTERVSSSVRASTADVLAGVPTTGPVTVLAARRLGGRLDVTRLRAGTRAEAERAVATAQDLPGVLDVAVDNPVHLLSTSGVEDPLRSRQWALTRLRDREARALSTGAGTLVAVLDTGIDLGHEDLDSTRVLPGANYVPDGHRTPEDGNGHGSHVAGIIAAARDNGIGVAGLSDARILPMRVLDDDGNGTTSSLIAALDDAVAQGARVVNLSLGSTTYNAVLARVVADTIAAGVTVVAAGGNDRALGSPTEYPASLPGVLGVAAHNSSGRTSTFSSTGPQIDLAAPGEGIISLAERGQYASMSGTSQAAPYVSAAVAMVLAVAPRMTPAQVEALLEDTATDIDAPGRDSSSGAGALDVVAALQRLRPVAAPTTAAPTAAPTAGAPTTAPTAAPPTAAPTAAAPPAPAPAPRPSTPRPTATAAPITVATVPARVRAGRAFTVTARTPYLSGARVQVHYRRLPSGPWRAVAARFTSATAVGSVLALPATGPYEVRFARLAGPSQARTTYSAAVRVTAG